MQGIHTAASTATHTANTIVIPRQPTELLRSPTPGPLILPNRPRSCDQFYNGTVQSTAAQGYPNGSGCVQSDECLACLEAEGAITDKKAKPAWSAPACPDDCLPDGLVATNVVAELEYAATHESARPFFIAAGMKRPHLGWFAPDTSYAKYPNGSVELAAHRTPPSGMPKLAFGDNGEMVAMDDIPVDDSSGYPLVADWKQHELRCVHVCAGSAQNGTHRRLDCARG